MIGLAFRILLAWSVLLGALGMAGLAKPPHGLTQHQETAP
jgi:hypothetical protein